MLIDGPVTIISYSEYIRLLEKHAKMWAALVHLDTAIMPEERKYDEWGYCRIHKDILVEFDTVIKAAITAAADDNVELP